MKCKNCGRKMAFGTPHSEEIKFQLECSCGQIETVKYTPQELAARKSQEEK